MNRTTVSIPFAVVSGALAALAVPGASAQTGGLTPELLLSPWRAYATGEFPAYSPTSVAAGDLDGDQDLDVVVGHDYYGQPGIAVLKNNGNGTYGPPTLYNNAYGDVVGDVALSDVDGDGDLDVLGTIPDQFGNSRKLGYWRNNGNGTFSARRDFLTGTGPVGLVVGDFNGDGYPDVATANAGYIWTNNTISVLLHNGQTGAGAGFVAPVDFVATRGAECIDAADLDGDGDLDLAVGTAANDGAAVLVNNGAGAFGAPVFYQQVPGGGYTSDVVALADVDGDGDADLLTAGAENGLPNWGVLTVRRNNGAGVFDGGTAYRLPDWSWIPESLTTADINGDGALDVLATTPTGRTMDGYYVLLNNGSGAFNDARFYESAKYTWDVAAADADGDGDLDVLTAAYDSSVVAVHDNLGDGTFFVPDRVLVGSLSWDQEHGDIDGDGDPDIVTADSDIRILESNGDGTFQPMRTFDSPIGPGSVKLRDLDADGDLDLVIGPNPNNPPYHFATALNNGDGTFQQAVVTFVGASQGGAIEAIDFDNDGYRDVVLTDPGPADSIYIFRNNGTGTSFTFVEILDDSSWIIDGADFNHDGNNDLVGSTAFGITIWRGNGDFTFQDFLSEGNAATSLDIVDLDDDGNLDLVVLDPQPSFGTMSVSVYPGYGDGDFAFPLTFPGPSGREGAYRIAREIHGADITGDGLNDAIVIANAPGDVEVYPGLGDGTLGLPQRYGAGYSAQFASIADFNSDGALDAAVMISLPPGGFQDAIVMLENTGDGGGDVFTLDATGPCPGTVTLTATNATPGGTVAFAYAMGAGNVTIPSGPCAGTTLGLNQSATLLRTARADATGTATVQGNAPANACGRVVLQAVDVTTCDTSNVEGL